MIESVYVPLISMYSVLVAVGIGLLRFQKLSISIRLCLAVIFLQFCADFVSDLLYRNQMNSSGLLNIYIYIYHSSWWYCFYYLLKREPGYRRVLLGSLIVSNMLIAYLQNYEAVPNQINGYALGVASGHIIVLSLLYLIFIAFRTAEYRLEKHPYFIISCGLVMYHSVIICSVVIVNILPNDDVLFLWTIRSMIYIFLNLLIAFVFLKYSVRPNSQQ